MLSPQFLLPIARELIVDLFAGGGGASTGIEQAIGRHVDVAINHDPEAVSLHERNHPQTRHYVSDVFEVDPEAVCGGQSVGLMWASPDCKHFSKAKGGKPVSKKIRGLAWVVVKWAKLVRPRIIHLENVEEFQTWGPLLPNGRVCPDRKGRTFRTWKRQLERMGYVIEHRELRACDFGAPTIRKRLFLTARCDGQPIVWPTATHGAPATLPVREKKLKPWRTAAECIDWSIPCPSIFERNKELAEATMRRIAHGLKRYVIDSAKPYIVRIGQQGGNGTYTNDVDTPLTTITTKAEHLLASPTLLSVGYGERDGQAPRTLDIEKPLTTVVGAKKHALVSAFLAKHYGGVVGHEIDKPTGTVTTVDHHSLVAAHITKFHGTSAGAPMDDPLATVTSNSFIKRPGCAVPIGLVTSHLAKLRGTSASADTAEPLHTISAGGWHHAEVRALLIKYYGTDQDPDLHEPMHTVTTKDRFGLVTVKGEDYLIADIGMRMLQPRELYRAQGFPETYVIDIGADGRPLTKTAQVRMCGNSVCPPVACAIVAANYREMAGVPMLEAA